jgi:hypothetical protein
LSAATKAHVGCFRVVIDMMRRQALLAALLLLGSCGFGDDATVIDGSDQASFERTLADARRELGPKDRLKFEAALTEFRARMFARADTRAEYARLVREGMDGLTAPRIVNEFNKNVDDASGKAIDAIFDAKRELAGGSGSVVSGAP